MTAGISTLPEQRDQTFPKRSYHRTGRESYTSDLYFFKMFLHFFYNVICNCRCVSRMKLGPFTVEVVFQVCGDAKLLPVCGPCSGPK
jgi:hypothetical protein